MIGSGRQRSLKHQLQMSAFLKSNALRGPAAILFGDKFGESLEGSQAPPSFWEVPRLPRKFPEQPRKFFGNFPGGSLTVELSSNPGVPRKFPGLPRKFPKLPRKFPDFPGGQPLSLGSLTPSPDSHCSETFSCLFLWGTVSHTYRTICCKMGYRTDVPV